MRLVGSLPKLGQQNPEQMEKTPPIRMSRPPRPVTWLPNKYGQPMRPWEVTVTFQMDELKLPSEIFYSYSKSNQQGTEIVNERGLNRSFSIQPPEAYQGQLGLQKSVHWQHSGDVWIVNGVVDKADSNFLGGLFFDRVGETQILLGTYPLYDSDVVKMQDQGITAVLSLQTDFDMRQLNIPWESIKRTYKDKNIKCYRFPVADRQENELCANLFVGAQHLNHLVDKQKHTVYVHCSSGISRAPAVVIVYLCLFKRIKQWADPAAVAQFVKAFHPNSNPNMRAVNRVISANREFQRQQEESVPIHTSGLSPESKKEDLLGFYFPQIETEIARLETSPSRKKMTAKRSSYRKQPIQHFAQGRSSTPKPFVLGDLSSKAQLNVD